MSDYFVERPHFNTADFERRFRMQKKLFYRILNDVVNHEPYFRQKKDRLGRQGLSPEKKLTTIFYMLAWEALLALSTSTVDWVKAQLLNQYATLVKTTSSPDNPMKMLFAQMQEAYVKDVERAFGILHAQWAIVQGLTCMWCKDNLHLIMMTCIILHNMIVEDEYEYVEEESDDEETCPQRSMRARARQYELEPSITYEYRKDRQTLYDDMISHTTVQTPNVHQSL